KLTDHIFGTGSVLGNDFGSAPFAAYIEEITLLHLLTHTCGGWGNTGNDPMFSHPRFDHKRLIVETIANHPLQFQPGQHYSYSNFGYCILGRVIEKLSGESYSNFVQTEVLKPCGASGMQIAGNTLADIAVNEVHYYGQGGQNPYNLKVSRMDSHGGWIATASDLVSFALGVDGFPTPPDILSSQSIKTISKGSTVYPKYGCGWSISPTGNCWHMGSLPGTCTILVRTSRGISWAGLTNTRTVDQKPMTDDLDLLMWKMMRPITEAGRV
ncbi:MAG: serine hydrolase domain-containing protein, partial [Chthonomonadales bacterium]